MELMITVAIIAILAAIAMPSYLEHVKKTRRAAVQSFMLEVSTREEQFLIDNRAYVAAANNAAFAGALNLAVPGAGTDSDVASFYDLDVTVGATPPTFTITATAKGSQASDGNLTLNSAGVKTPVDKWH
jgi:type IV pilus assembly protein PilE